MINNPYPLSQTEFDVAMSEATQIGDLIYLPDEVIDWALIINNPCTIMADENTSLNVSTYTLTDTTPVDQGGPGDIPTNRTYNYDISEPVVITTKANIIGLSVINRKDVGYIGYKITAPAILTDTIAEASIAYKLEGVNGGEFENINGHSSTTGLRLQNCMNNNFVDASFADNDVGIELIGTSTTIGDSSDYWYQELGLNVTGTNPAGLTDNSNYYITINGTEFLITTGVSTTYNDLINIMNTAFSGDYTALFYNTSDIRIIKNSAGTLNITAGTTGDDLLVSINSVVEPAMNIAEKDRTDRTHHNKFTSTAIFQNKIGINFVNSNHNTFESSTVKTSTNIGIFHTPNSYSNSFRGEIFENQNYGVRNLDKEGGVHIFDAMDCWWGDITGPSSFGPGTGDKISSNVTFEPWRKSGTEPDLMYPVTRDWIWAMLGDPLVRVELTEQQISNAIDMAVKRWMYFRTSEPNYYYLNIDAATQNVLLPPDLPKESIIEVVYQPYSDLYAQLSGSGESFFLTYYMQKSGGTFLADFWISIQYKEMFERKLGINPTYEFLSYQDPISGEVQDIIKIYPRPSNNMRIAVKYSRVLNEAEVDANAWIRKYALAWAKEMLGRVRSKFASVPGPTGELSLDGSQLLTEAAQEKEALDLEVVQKGNPLGFTTG